ncbi:spheroidene monooxygenase [Frankia sp. CcI49]|uniref:hypothetical protein n=1 Tax=unclassified Frankia TaxID=2632575 RepID=UPI0006C9FD13|nr:MULTISPECIES: hypothetical protein [unclassified Frankia]KPM55578.1 spheroidene monooxygenase [Frankia sp. R43]ONH62255.1 spheroidene monooxygenase [Frankia sp. CcI49]
MEAVKACMFVTFDLWHVPRRRAAQAAARMALDRPRLRQASGLTFSRLLGTGGGRRFTPLDADPSRWALLAVWDTPAAARAFERSSTIRAWARLADERWRVDLRPLHSRGLWSGQAPFGPQPGAGSGRPPVHDRHDAPVATPAGDAPAGDAPAGDTPARDTPVVALTRARLAPRRAVLFWRAVPPVAAELRDADGLLFTAGIGEAPIGYQGTFSVWRDSAALRAFAYQGRAHAAVVQRTPRERWYAEELFARFAVLGSHGTVRGTDPCAGRLGATARLPTAHVTDDATERRGEHTDEHGADAPRTPDAADGGS